MACGVPWHAEKKAAKPGLARHLISWVAFAPLHDAPPHSSKHVMGIERQYFESLKLKTTLDNTRTYKHLKTYGDEGLRLMGTKALPGLTSLLVLNKA